MTELLNTIGNALESPENIECFRNYKLVDLEIKEFQLEDIEENTFKKRFEAAFIIFNDCVKKQMQYRKRIDFHLKLCTKNCICSTGPVLNALGVTFDTFQDISNLKI